MYASRIISYYAILINRPSYLVHKSVDMLLHVAACKLIYADNNPQWVAIGIFLIKPDYQLKTCGYNISRLFLNVLRAHCF